MKIQSFRRIAGHSCLQSHRQQGLAPMRAGPPCRAGFPAGLGPSSRKAGPPAGLDPPTGLDPHRAGFSTGLDPPQGSTPHRVGPPAERNNEHVDGKDTEKVTGDAGKLSGRNNYMPPIPYAASPADDLAALSLYLDQELGRVKQETASSFQQVGDRCRGMIRAIGQKRLCREETTSKTPHQHADLQRSRSHADLQRSRDSSCICQNCGFKQTANLTSDRPRAVLLTANLTADMTRAVRLTANLTADMPRAVRLTTNPTAGIPRAVRLTANLSTRAVCRSPMSYALGSLEGSQHNTESGT